MTRVRSSAPMWKLVLPMVLAAVVITAISAGATQAGPNTRGPRFTEAAAFDVSKPLRELVKNQKPTTKVLPPATGKDTDSELSADTAAESARLAPGSSIQAAAVQQAANGQELATAIPGTIANFEGLSNQDNFNIFGGPRKPTGSGG